MPYYHEILDEINRTKDSYQAQFSLYFDQTKLMFHRKFRFSIPDGEKELDATEDTHFTRVQIAITTNVCDNRAIIRCCPSLPKARCLPSSSKFFAMKILLKYSLLNLGYIIIIVNYLRKLCM